MSSYKRDSELPVLCYVNKAHVLYLFLCKTSTLLWHNPTPGDQELDKFESTLHTDDYTQVSAFLEKIFFKYQKIFNNSSLSPLKRGSDHLFSQT